MKAILGTIKSSLPEIVQGTNSNAFRAAGQAMAELGVASCIGTACVKTELLTSATVQALSKATFSILLPMFLGTSIIKTVTADHGSLDHRSSLAIPVLAVMQTMSLFVLSKHFLLPLFGITSADGDDEATMCNGNTVGATLVCCAWGNSGVVPLIFAEALFRHPYEPASVLAQCCGCISLYLVGWSPYFWSFGRSVLINNKRKEKMNKPIESDEVDWVATFLENFREIKSLFPPPVVGVVVGLMIGLSPLRHLFVSNASKEYKAPLEVVFNSFQNLGRAASPLALLVLTSSLAIGAGGNSSKSIPIQQKQTNNESTGVNLKNANMLRQWACVSTARFILSPLIMWAFLRGMYKLNMIGDIVNAPILWFSLLLESCMPPAQNSVLMLQVANRKNEASNLARFLLSAYITAMIPVAFIVATSLQKLGLA